MNFLFRNFTINNYIKDFNMAVAERKQFLNVLNALVTKGITNKFGRIEGEGRRILHSVFNNYGPGWSTLF